jgi:hypothetical protein
MAGEATKARILQQVAGSRSYASQGQARYLVDGTVVHVRYKSNPSHGASYPYNINPNTLRADYELWICGDDDGWYLIPMDAIREIYEDPHAYVDKHHPEIRVVTVNAASHEVAYGAGARSVSFRVYRNAHLP